MILLLVAKQVNDKMCSLTHLGCIEEQVCYHAPQTERPAKLLKEARASGVKELLNVFRRREEISTAGKLYNVYPIHFKNQCCYRSIE